MRLDIPARWTEILRAIQAVVPGAIIGGGALRDLDNGREVKDLDVFVPFDTNFEDVRYAVGYLHDCYDVDQDICASYMGATFDVERIVEFTTLGMSDWPVLNVIAVEAGKTPVEDAQRYDFGLCQIFYDGTDVVATADYHADKRSQTLTLIRGDNPVQVRRSLKRYERLKQKYPWPLGIGPSAHNAFLELQAQL